jgi:hypothetical protein
MLIMQTTFYYKLSLFLKIKKSNLNKNKIPLYLSIKNYYLVLKKYRFLKLYSPQDTLHLLYSNMYFLNLLQNKTIDK